MLKFGYKASAEQFEPRELLEYAVLAEDLGFDSVAVSDHFQPWRHDGGHAPYSLSWLSALGARTSRIELGTSVVTPTFRYHPASIAQAFATMACLFPGRVWLGVGTGESMNEVPLGIDWPEPKVRFARLREAVDLIRRLWTEDRLTFTGEYYQTRSATIYDKPDRLVPLYIAASGPAATRYAGRTSDGFICTSGKGMSMYTDNLLPNLKRGAEQASRDYESIEKTIEMKVSFDNDLSRARADTSYWAALALTQEEKIGVEDPMVLQRLADALPIDRAASRWIVSADPDEHVRALKEYLDLGFTHMIFHAPGPDQARFLKLYAKDVLPRLRALSDAERVEAVEEST
jgi:coenzyme F420-dependent glucose-6-phosphate dehydrogenase